MDFARKQLEKYGWSDGKGLGKNENGIAEALKPKLKRSVAGIGHDAAAEFTEHWWCELYNKASSNLEVREKNGKTKKIEPKEAFEITNSTWKLKRKHKDKTEEAQYGDFFVKKAVLTSGGAKIKKVYNSQSDEEETVATDSFKMTDEELFAACEGRTAHKGARHGLRALGKLARIEQQEKMLLSETKYEGYSHKKKISSVNDLQVVEDMNLNSDGDGGVKKKKKKKRRHRLSNDQYFQETNVKLFPGNIDKTEEKIDVTESFNNENTAMAEPEESGRKESKKKRKLLEGKLERECRNNPTKFENAHKKSKKESKRAKSVNNHESIVEDSVVAKSKKKKNQQDTL